MTKLRILITGASRGIGLATAKKLAKRHKLALFDIDEKELHTVTNGKDFKNWQKPPLLRVKWTSPTPMIGITPLLKCKMLSAESTFSSTMLASLSLANCLTPT